MTGFDDAQREGEEAKKPRDRETCTEEALGADASMLEGSFPASGTAPNDTAIGRGEPISVRTAGGFLLKEPSIDFPILDAPQQLGAYEVLDCLGEGGMGVVYRAQQTAPVQRQVALKVLKSRASLTRATIIRFEAEQQAMALLSHPNVAQLYDAGTAPTGQPYFAMELVDGVTITEFCDENRLVLRDRLALFRMVCQGVQHAHQSGILHRDLKPSNVMVKTVDGQAIPKIIDFGIAKAIDQRLSSETLVTGEGLIGTLGYLSPEAAKNLPIDTRSDVYSLGILLYELLIGVRPFDHDDGSFIEVLRRILEDDPPSLSRCWSGLDAEARQRLATARKLDAGTPLRGLEVDLEWIVAKAVAKDRDERYASAAELADEIDRHLLDEPVEASPPDSLYRLRKFIRRHRGAVTAAALVFASLALGLIVRTIEARRANHEAEAARQTTRFLVDLFEVVDPLREARVGMTARELIERGSQRVRSELHDQPLVRARLLDTLATVNGNLGLYEASAELAEEAVSLRRSHLPADHTDLASSLETLAQAQLRLDRYAEAEVLLLESIDIRGSAFGSQHEDLARPLGLLGHVCKMLDRPDEAVNYFRRALRIQEVALGPRHLSSAETMSGLGGVLAWAGQQEEAEALSRRSLSIREERLGPRHALVADSLEQLALSVASDDRYGEALDTLARALEIREAIYGSDNSEIVQTLSLIGRHALEWGRYDQAEAAFERVAELTRSPTGRQPRELGVALTGLALIAENRELHEQCIALNREANVIFESVSGPKGADVAWTLTNIANCQMGLSRLDEAETAYLESRSIFERIHGPDHPTTAIPQLNLGFVYIERGMLDQAEASFRETLRVFETAYGADHSRVAFPCEGLGDVYKARTDYATAEYWLRRGLEIREASLDPGARERIEIALSLAEVLRAQGREREARKLETGTPSLEDDRATTPGGSSEGT